MASDWIRKAFIDIPESSRRYTWVCRGSIPQAQLRKGKIILPKSIRLGLGNFDPFPIQNFLTFVQNINLI